MPADLFRATVLVGSAWPEQRLFSCGFREFDAPTVSTGGSAIFTTGGRGCQIGVLEQSVKAVSKFMEIYSPKTVRERYTPMLQKNKQVRCSPLFCLSGIAGDCITLTHVPKI